MTSSQPPILPPCSTANATIKIANARYNHFISASSLPQVCARADNPLKARYRQAGRSALLRTFNRAFNAIKESGEAAELAEDADKQDEQTDRN